MDEYKPSPDSQFRLRPCKCGSEDVVYQSYDGMTGHVHRVRCNNCYRRTLWKRCRHDAQVEWNRHMRCEKQEV